MAVDLYKRPRPAPPRSDASGPVDGRPVPLWGQLGPPVPVPAPDDDAMRDVPMLIRPQARASWQPLVADIGNPWFRVPQDQNLRLFEQLVETIPIINAALDRIVQLVGCPYVDADDETKDELDTWMRNVVVNRICTGFENWFSCWIKDHLIYGRAHAELILPVNRRDIYAIQELHSRTIDLRPTRDGYSLDIVQIMAMRGMWITLNKRLIVTATHDLRNDMPHGHSLLYGLPFVAEIFTSMMKDQRRIWERFGTPIYHVRYVPPETLPDPTGARSQFYITSIMNNWNTMMQDRANGLVQDFGTSGDIVVEVIGAKGETLDFVAPLKEIITQIVARTGLPPWMLGLQWQRTETMSMVEASMLGEMVDEIRRHVQPEIEYILKLRQLLAGKNPEFKLSWKSPNLIDELQTARAELFQSKADAQKLATQQDLWKLGIVTNVMVAKEFRPDLSEKTDEEILALLPDLPDLPPDPAPAPEGYGAELSPDAVGTHPGPGGSSGPGGGSRLGGAKAENERLAHWRRIERALYPGKDLPAGIHSPSQAGIYLIAHGGTALNDPPDRVQGWMDVPLSGEGRRQAREVAGRLEGLGIGAVLTSDLRRAMETADSIAHVLGLPLPERQAEWRPWNLGEFQGQPSAAAHPLIAPYVTETADEPVPGGESFAQFGARYVQALKRVMSGFELGLDGNLAIVTHSRNLSLVKACRGCMHEVDPMQGCDAQTFLDDDVKPGEVLCLEREGDGWRIEMLPQQAALPDSVTMYPDTGHPEYGGVRNFALNGNGRH